MDELKIRRVLLSVSDKSGLEELVRALSRHNVDIVSTGNTARFIAELGYRVRTVSQVTGMSEMFDGRVKTLHPKIHGALLADTRLEKHRQQVEQLGIDLFDLVVVNLYPFAQTLQRPGVTDDEIIEQIDIGGPALIRGAAKNHQRVTVVVDPADYPQIIESMQTSLPQRRRLAAKAYAHTSEYDRQINAWFSGGPTDYSNDLTDYSEDLAAQMPDVFVGPDQTEYPEAVAANTPPPGASNPGLGVDTSAPSAAGYVPVVDYRPRPQTPEETPSLLGTDAITSQIFSATSRLIKTPQTVSVDSDDSFIGDLQLTAQKLATLRYGENSHQRAALYWGDDNTSAELIAAAPENPGSLAGAELLGGRQMSYNNYLDADAALRLVYSFDQPAAAVVKHTNPCGVATDNSDILVAYQKAYECDTASAFGGIVAANRTVTLALAQELKPVFIEAIVAPDYEPAALELLLTKKNLRILRVADYALPSRTIRQIAGGFLVQQADQSAREDLASAWRQVAGPQDVSPEVLADLEFAWRACALVKSNAILLAKNQASIGIGMGQVNRLDACHLAVKRAAGRARGAVAASDAFFPFSDGLEVLINAGVTAVVHPGGSIRDSEVVAAAEQAGIVMFFTGRRHFSH